jgi:outer membrane biosynthesis protein TonB
MGRLNASLLALALAALAALGVSACGSGGNPDLLPGSTASEITSNLDQVKELATAGDCVGAEDAAQAVSSQIEELGGVDRKLKQALREGATRLNEVVAGCEELETEEDVPAIEPAEELEEEKEPKEKPEKAEKPDKAEKKEEAAEETETETAPTLPPEAEGKAKGHEKQEETEAPAEETGGTSAGGVGPGAAAGSE